MQKICLIFGLLLTVSMVNAQVVDYAKEGFPPLQPAITPSVTPKEYNRIKTKEVKNYNKLARLERKVFNRTFENDYPENRIARLEEQVMGAIQCGDINSRYAVLQKAVPKYLSRIYSPDISPYCGIPVMSGSGWRGLAGSLGNFFSGNYMGYPTGMSPQINMPNFNNFAPDFQRMNFSNTGWGYNNQNIGTGSGVHIID